MQNFRAFSTTLDFLSIHMGKRYTFAKFAQCTGNVSVFLGDEMTEKGR